MADEREMIDWASSRKTGDATTPSFNALACAS
jgi:hypothetical protein